MNVDPTTKQVLEAVQSEIKRRIDEINANPYDGLHEYRERRHNAIRGLAAWVVRDREVVVHTISAHYDWCTTGVDKRKWSSQRCLSPVTKCWLSGSGNRWNGVKSRCPER